MLRPGEVCIHAGNAHEYTVDVAVGGEHKARGLAPRNYATHPVGCYATLPPLGVDFPLIPESEWSERLRDKIAQKSLLSDLRLTGNAGQPIPSRDQNGKGYSHSEDTEVLTAKGWVRWPDWNHADLLASVNTVTGLMEFQAPTEWHAYEYDDEIYGCTNRRLDFAVTRNHRMLVRKWDEARRTLSGGYTFQRADELGWYVGMMHAPRGFLGTEMVEVSPEGDGRAYDGDDFIALVAAVTSCGYAGGSESTRDRVGFCCFDGRRYPAYAALARRVGFAEQPSRRGVFSAYRAGLANWFRSNGYAGGLRAPNKRVPDIVKWASTRQIKLFLAWFGDRNHGEGAQPAFYSSSKRVIDDLQELLLRVGKRGTIGARGPRRAVYEAAGKVIESGPSYVLTVGETDRLCIDRKKHIETDHYKGLVYCATVPNGTLVTRRNGSVLLSGNCWAHSTTSAMLLHRCASNQPYADLSAYAVACVIKGFRDEGGWGAESADFVAQRGIPTAQFWPQRSMSRDNDKPETWADAAKHKITAGWWDVGTDQYDRKLTWAQLMTLWLSDCPTVNDYNWWSHSVCGADPVEGASTWGKLRADSGKRMTRKMFDFVWGMDSDDAAAGWGCRIWNSWSDSWSAQGMGVLAAGKAVPDGSVALKTTTVSEG